MDIPLLQQYVAQFVQELQGSTKEQEHVKDHQRRSQRAQALLAQERIPALTEDDLRQLFFDADAFGFWGNKEWEFNHRLTTFGLDGLRRALGELIACGEGSLTPEDLKRIWGMRGLGTLLSTELLSYRFPDRYWTYNAPVTLAGLQALGEDARADMPRGQRSDPYIYFAIQGSLDEVRRALEQAGIQDVNYLFVDIFLWWLKRSQPDGKIPDVERAVIIQAIEKFDAENEAS
jgi:hypothetical protein